MAILASGSTAGMADDGAGNPIADSYGSLTQAADTVITRLVPPRTSLRARVTDLMYTAGATAHTITMMPALVKGKITQGAASGQAVIKIDQVPTNPLDGSILAAGDLVSFCYQDDTWEIAAVSSLSGSSVTLTANLSKAVDANSEIFFHFAPADHTNRRYTAAASGTLTITNGNLCTCPTKSYPIIVHSNNATAAGTLLKLGYTYVDGNPS